MHYWKYAYQYDCLLTSWAAFGELSGSPTMIRFASFDFGRSTIEKHVFFSFIHSICVERAFHQFLILRLIWFKFLILSVLGSISAHHNTLMYRIMWSLSWILWRIVNASNCVTELKKKSLIQIILQFDSIRHSRFPSSVYSYSFHLNLLILI